MAERSRGHLGMPHLAGLDGIRGLSALAVLLFHAGVSWLPGGFLGVDVFFIVSGYLITALLLAERKRDGSISLAQFWQRRARRLLPALLLILFATTLYAAIQLREDLLSHLREAAGALIYVTNWDLILREISYWDLFERPSQLRHLWSLAVEEQFYVVWPLLFFAISTLRSERLWSWMLPGIVLLGAIASVIWMLVLHDPGGDSSRVYFGSDTRAFTILIGVGLAFVWRPWLRQRREASSGGVLLSELATIVGLGAVLALGWLMLSASSLDAWLYPWGLLALSLAAAALVAAVALQSGFCHHVLGSGPLRWLGERSYSIYLWHWPVVLALTWEYGLRPGSIELVLACIGLTFLLAELSYRLVESPLRRPSFWRQLLRPRRLAERTAIYTMVCLLVVVSAVGLALLPNSRADDDLANAMFSQDQEEDQVGEQAVSAESAASIQAAATEAQPSEDDEPVIIVTTSVRRRSGADLDTANQASERNQRLQTDGSTEAVSSPQSGGSESATAAVPGAEERDDSAAAVADTEDAAADSGFDLLERPPANSDPAPAEQNDFQYVVREGDSPIRIVETFGTTIDAYIEYNGVRYLESLLPGDVLRLPCPGESACGLIDLDPAAKTCIAWEGTSACRRVTTFISAPTTFRIATPDLHMPPTWTWGDHTYRGESFTLRASHLQQLSRRTESDAAPRGGHLQGRIGLPPLAVGDSVMRHARFALRDAGLEVDALGGRTARQSMSALRQHLERGGTERVVIFQGIGYQFVSPDDLRDLMRMVEQVEHVIILTHQFPEQPPWISLERSLNDTLRSQADTYGNLKLLDWHAISEERTDELTTDGAHLNPDGIELYVGVIVGAIESSLAGFGAAPAVAAVQVQQVREPAEALAEPQPGSLTDIEQGEAVRLAHQLRANEVTAINSRIASPVAPLAAPQGASRGASPSAESSARPEIRWSFEYLVREGDYPLRVADQFGVSFAQLQDLNGEDPATWMLAGRTIRIPCPGLGACAMVTISPGNGICVTWSTADARGDICRRAHLLVTSFPIHFRQPDNHALTTPRWRLADQQSVADRFTITAAMLQPLSAGERELVAGASLPPLAIGDSVMTAAKPALIELGIDVDSVEGRDFDVSLRVLSNHLASRGPRDVVVFHALGYNFVDAAAFQRLIDAARGTKHLIVMTRNLSFRSEVAQLEVRINSMLREEAPKYSWITILDWEAIVEGREDELTYDGTHLNPAGQTVFANVILDAIARGPSGVRVQTRSGGSGLGGG